MELSPTLETERLQLGKYEIIKYLAAGGMAEVFLARVTGLLGFDKPVVIKRILPHLANRQDFIGMFLDEARIGMLLQHPNIVQTYDVGVANRNYFIAMEYLHGETVRETMRELHVAERRMPIEHAVHIGSAVANALHYAHERSENGQLLGIVHRDVTPQNVMVTFDGTVKLLDFGIAKAQNRFGETRSGTLKGKLPYMSPEQCRGEELDRRSDVFSLGIMIYELTLGRRLFSGVSDFQILKQIAEGEITPPSTLDPQYPPALEAIVLRALRKPPAERYQTAREMLVELDAFARHERLHTSTMALADFVGSVFKDKVDAWKSAAENGASLEDHVRARQEPSPNDDLSLHYDLPKTQNALSPMTPTASMASGGNDDTPLAGPDIPVTPPFSLEFTRAGDDSAPTPIAIPATEVVTPAPPPRPARTSPLVLALGAVAFIGLGVAITVSFLRHDAPQPVVLREPAVAASPNVVPLIAGEPAPQIVTPPTVVIASTEPATKPGVTLPSHGKPHAHGRETPAAHAKVAPPTKAKVTGEGTLVLATTPWCNVFVDGLARGTTPITITLPAGHHTIGLTNPEFKVKRALSVTIEPNATTRKRLDFDTP